MCVKLHAACTVRAGKLGAKREESGTRCCCLHFLLLLLLLLRIYFLYNIWGDTIKQQSMHMRGGYDNSWRKQQTRVLYLSLALFAVTPDRTAASADSVVNRPSDLRTVRLQRRPGLAFRRHRRRWWCRRDGYPQRW